MRLRGVRGQADAGVDHHGHVGKRARKSSSAYGLARPRAEPIGAPHGIITPQPASQQAGRPRSDPRWCRGTPGSRRWSGCAAASTSSNTSGCKRVVVADHLELDPGRAEHLARHLRRGDGLAHAVAAGGVGQHADAEAVDRATRTLAPPVPRPIRGAARPSRSRRRAALIACAGWRATDTERRAHQQAGRKLGAVESQHGSPAFTHLPRREDLDASPLCSASRPSARAAPARRPFTAVATPALKAQLAQQVVEGLGRRPRVGSLLTSGASITSMVGSAHAAHARRSVRRARARAGSRGGRGR